MDITKLVRKIKYKAGYPVVPLEIDDSVIIDMVYDSFDDLQEYFNLNVTKTVGLNGDCIDLKDHKDIYRVHYILSTTGYSSNEFNVFNPGTQIMQSNIGMNGFNSNSNSNLIGSSYYTRRLIGAGYEKLLAENNHIDFRLANNSIYVDNEHSDSEVTLVGDLKMTLDTIDEYWGRQVIRYTANTMLLMLGRARKKYTSKDSLYEIDTDILNDAKQDMENHLKELKDGEVFFAISV